MERETGLEPATSSLGNWANIVNTDFSVSGSDFKRQKITEFPRLCSAVLLTECKRSTAANRGLANASLRIRLQASGEPSPRSRALPSCPGSDRGCQGPALVRCHKGSGWRQRDPVENQSSILPKQLLGQLGMHLPLLVKFRKIRDRQRGGASPWWTAEQGRLQPVFVPILAQRPRDSGCCGSLQIVVDGCEANRTTAGDLPQTQARPLQISISMFFGLAHGQSPGWQAILPFFGEAACHCVVQRR